MKGERHAIWTWACMRKGYIETSDVVRAFKVDCRTASRHLAEMNRLGSMRRERGKTRYGLTYRYYVMRQYPPPGCGCYERAKQKAPAFVAVQTRKVKGHRVRHIPVECLPLVLMQGADRDCASGVAAVA